MGSRCSSLSIEFLLLRRMGVRFLKYNMNNPCEKNNELAFFVNKWQMRGGSVDSHLEL